MKYIFAIDDHLRRKHGGSINEMYSFLCKLYKNVVIYHRSCKKPPLFSGDTMIISASPSCQRAFSSFASCASFWDIFDSVSSTHGTWKDNYNFSEVREDYAA